MGSSNSPRATQSLDKEELQRSLMLIEASRALKGGGGQKPLKRHGHVSEISSISVLDKCWQTLGCGVMIQSRVPSSFPIHQTLGASLVAHMVKCLPAMQETRVQSLVQEDPLEKEIAAHSSTLAWKIPWTKEPGGLQSMGSQRVGHN